MDEFTQDWEVYQVLSSNMRLADYVQLDTICNVDDLLNMVEIIEAKEELDAIREKRDRENQVNQ